MNSTKTLLVGIDWADTKHDYHLITSDGEHQLGQFKQHPKDIAEIVQAWRELSDQSSIAIAVESSKGPLINALLQFDNLTIYPVNPTALANYRKSFAHGGGKNDPADAELIASFLRERIDCIKPLRKDMDITRELAILVEDRRRLVDHRADLTNELKAVLKQYFPALLELSPAKHYADFFLEFLIKYSTLEQAKKAGEAKLRKFFHGVRMKVRADAHAKSLVNAIALTTDQVLLKTHSRRAVAIAEQMQVMTKHVRRYNTDLKKLLPEHPDYAFVKSLPGASTNTQARMIAALGDDRSRYPGAASLQAACGIAPITVQSGKRKQVYARWATSKFMRQTFHEYAGLSILSSRWARAYFDQQLDAGKSVNQAKRTLAYKWQRIIHACWESGELYDEDRYIRRLAATGSPTYTALAKTA